MEWSIFNHLYYSKKANAYLLYSSLSNMIVELNKNGYDEILKIKSYIESFDPSEKIFTKKQALDLIKKSISETNTNGG